jgi:hypothetical protein
MSGAQKGGGRSNDRREQTAIDASTARPVPEITATCSTPAAAVPGDASLLAPGTRIGRYVIEGVLGGAAWRPSTGRATSPWIASSP